jgi:ankyrin repeat protein
LTHACKLQNGPAVAALLEVGADPNFANKKGVTPISAAAHKGNIEIMQSLIMTGSNVNALNSSGSTALIQVRFVISLVENSIFL